MSSKRAKGGNRLSEPSLSYIEWADIGRASDAWAVADGAVGSPYDEFRGKYLPLPEWFQQGLDPTRPEYAHQQDRLWQLMVGEETNYNPSRDEMTGPPHGWLDACVRPGLYSAPTAIAGDHLIAMGHILKYSNVTRDDRVLEYGAGFGQIALTFARMGAEVHTVDIEEQFCAAVRAQAELFKVNLTAHSGHFGDNPAGGKYKLILFYEAFHHARSFVNLIARLRELLEPDGRIVMAGEPIQPSSDAEFSKSCPYPWGIRLEAEVAAIVRRRRWYELGFREEFLLKLFFQKGFLFSVHRGYISHYATVYVFSPRPNVMLLSEVELPPEDESTWHGREPNGRWTKDQSRVTVDTSTDWSSLKLDISNFHPRSTRAVIRLGEMGEAVVLNPHERRTVSLLRKEGGSTLTLNVESIVPTSYGVADTRPLGVFVHSISYE